MRLERIKDTSIYYWLKDLFEPYNFVDIGDEYREIDFTVPSVVVKNGILTASQFELGNREQRNFRVWFFDIYAKNKEQRNDFAYYILDELDNGIPVLDFNEGYPPTVSPTQIGAIVTLEKNYTPIDVIPELVEKMYWRGQVRIFTEYSPY